MNAWRSIGFDREIVEDNGSERILKIHQRNSSGRKEKKFTLIREFCFEWRLTNTILEISSPNRISNHDDVQLWISYQWIGFYRMDLIPNKIDDWNTE